MSSRAGGDLAGATKREVETFLDGKLVEHSVPGASVAVADRDGTLHAAGIGARDLETGAPATPDTLYSFGSFTKVVTAMAVLWLVDRGDLALDDPVPDHVPYWADAPGDPVTVGEVLSHSSGMPADYGGDRAYLFSEDPPSSPFVTLEDVRRHANAAADRRIVDEERFMYSNRGYHVLGELVEAVDGRPYGEVVEAELLDPLGMERSRIGYGEISEADEDAARAHAMEDGSPTPSEFDLDADSLGPQSAGGLLTSVVEVTALLRCLSNGGELDGTRVLDADLVGAMCDYQSPDLETIDGRREGCGYGPQLSEFLGERAVWHTGTSPGVGRAFGGFLPERGLGVAVGANAPDVPMEAVGKGVLAIAAGEDPVEVVPHLALRRKVRAVAGTYEGFRGGATLTVEPAGDDTHVEVAHEDAPDRSFPAFPDSVAHDDYSFYRVREGGLRESLDFHDTGAGMELRVNADRLERTRGG